LTLRFIHKTEALYCARFTRKLGESETANPVIQGEEDSLKVAKKILKVNIKWAHDCLGHLRKDITCKIAAQLGMELSGLDFKIVKHLQLERQNSAIFPKKL
jgi:hypothetical protein